MTASTKRLQRQRPRPKAGIIHFGLGAFFRAHGALIIEEAMLRSGGNWGIVGVSLKTPNICNRLEAQDTVYSAVELAPNARNLAVSEIITETIFAPEAAELLLSKLADPDIKILSLTITEKGYCHIPSTGRLNLRHPEIISDINRIKQGAAPCTAIGYIVSGLQRRKAAGLKPFTIMSCDNLPNNGQVTRSVVVELAEQIDSGLASWIENAACFPATMVDRIVPATTEADIQALYDEHNVMDKTAVFHEPFCQWVIEDKFVDGDRPDFTTLQSVQLVADVTPFELMKIRMLNGTHSSLAYLGYLAGYETISDAVADATFKKFVTELWQAEIIPSLVAPENTDLAKYADQLLARYQNAAIKHRTWQIAMDGSQKLPQRILNTIAQNLQAGRKSSRLLLAVAAWIKYAGGVDMTGQPIDVRDPIAPKLQALSEADGTSSEIVSRFLDLGEVFGSELPVLIKTELINAYNSLETLGVQGAIENV